MTVLALGLEQPIDKEAALFPVMLTVLFERRNGLLRGRFGVLPITVRPAGISTLEIMVNEKIAGGHRLRPIGRLATLNATTRSGRLGDFLVRLFELAERDEYGQRTWQLRGRPLIVPC